jgi:hypothetical protein
LRASRRMAACTDVALAPSFETPCFARLLRMRFIDDIDMIRTSETPVLVLRLQHFVSVIPGRRSEAEANPESTLTLETDWMGRGYGFRAPADAGPGMTPK